jgi:hypothetical protein
MNNSPAGFALVRLLLRLVLRPLFRVSVSGPREVIPSCHVRLKAMAAAI